MKKGMKDLSYQELDIKQRTQAIMEMDKIIKNMYKLSPTSLWTDRVVLECIINKIDPTFDKKGSIRNLSNTYHKIPQDLMQKVYDQCKKLVS
jgi:hypothetical protein